MEYIGPGSGTNRWELISRLIHLPATEPQIAPAIAAPTRPYIGLLNCETFSP
jgi:hypothetical protein